MKIVPTCASPIIKKETSTRVTYCILPQGHKGKCIDRIEKQNIIDLRCESTSPNGNRCGLPKGHPGNHSLADGHATKESWS